MQNKQEKIEKTTTVAEDGIFFSDMNLKVGGIEICSLNIPMEMAKLWTGDKKLIFCDPLHQSEDVNTVVLSPEEYLFSDEFLNDPDAQDDLIRFALDKMQNKDGEAKRLKPGFYKIPEIKEIFRVAHDGKIFSVLETSGQLTPFIHSRHSDYDNHKVLPAGGKDFIAAWTKAVSCTEEAKMEEVA